MLLSFMESVAQYINAPLVVHSPIKYGGLDVKKEGVALRVIPAPPGERYFEGRTDLVNFQILVKFKSQREAINKIGQIAEKLTEVGSGSIAFIGGGYNVLSCDVYTAPNQVEKTDTHEYIYTALFRAEVEKIGGL